MTSLVNYDLSWYISRKTGHEKLNSLDPKISYTLFRNPHKCLRRYRIGMRLNNRRTIIRAHRYLSIKGDIADERNTQLVRDTQCSPFPEYINLAATMRADQSMKKVWIYAKSWKSK